jgi:hypothetical protein
MCLRSMCAGAGAGGGLHRRALGAHVQAVPVAHEPKDLAAREPAIRCLRVQAHGTTEITYRLFSTLSYVTVFHFVFYFIICFLLYHLLSTSSYVTVFCFVNGCLCTPPASRCLSQPLQIRRRRHTSAVRFVVNQHRVYGTAVLWLRQRVLVSRVLANNIRLYKHINLSTCR